MFRGRLPRRSALILFGLVVLALGIDFIFYTGFYASDDMGYLEGARGLAGDGYWTPELATNRLGLTLPSSLIWWISDGSISAVIWFQIIYHLGLVLISYALARLMLNGRAGLIAAALMAVNPLVYGFAGALLPDNPATFWLGGCLIALVATKRFADPGTRVTSWNRRRFVGYFVAGLMLGFCYWCKETALILTIPAAVFIMTAGPSFRSLVWIQNGAILSLGLLSAMALELFVFRITTGEWINRLAMMSDSSASQPFWEADMLEQGATPFARFATAGDLLSDWLPLSMWILIAGTIAYGFTRARNAGLQMFMWWPALYLTIGTASFSKYLPPTIQARYYAIVVLPAVVMTAVVFSILLERWDGVGRAWVQKFRIVAALALLGGFECRSNLGHSGTIYFATEARGMMMAIEEARERYPHHKIVLAPYYSARMDWLVINRPDIWVDRRGRRRPRPPYIYIRKIGPFEGYDRNPIAPPPNRVDLIFEEIPPSNRWALLKDLGRRMFEGKRVRMKRAPEPRGAEAWLIRGPLPPGAK